MGDPPSFVTYSIITLIEVVLVSEGLKLGAVVGVYGRSATKADTMLLYFVPI
jgi:hypothetical protein